MKSTLLIALAMFASSIFAGAALAQAPQVISTVPARNETDGGGIPE